MSGRRVSGALLALIGAVAVGYSAYLEWLKEGDQKPKDMKFSRLYDSDATALQDMTTSYWSSIAIPLVAVTALGVIGAVLRSRSVLWLGFLVALATLVLFPLFTIQAADSAGISVGASDLDIGYWLAVAGAVVLFIGILTMGGRPNNSAMAESTSVADDAGYPTI